MNVFPNRAFFVVIGLVLVMGASACGGTTSTGPTPSTPTTAPTTAPRPTNASTFTVQTAQATVNGKATKILTDAQGRTLYLLSCVIVIVLVPLLLTTAVAQAQAAPWRVVKSPNPGAGNGLFGAASISAKDVWAVGNFSSSGVPEQTLIEHWNGTSWSVVASPSPSATTNLLEAAAANPSSGQAWAVGDFSTPTMIDTLTEFNP